MYKCLTLAVAVAGAVIAGVVYKSKKDNAELVAKLDKAYENGKRKEQEKAEVVDAEEIAIRT